MSAAVAAPPRPDLVWRQNFEKAEAEGRASPLVLDPHLSALGDMSISNITWLLRRVGVESLAVVPAYLHAATGQPLATVLAAVAAVLAGLDVTFAIRRAFYPPPDTVVVTADARGGLEYVYVEPSTTDGVDGGAGAGGAGSGGSAGDGAWADGDVPRGSGGGVGGGSPLATLSPLASGLLSVSRRPGGAANFRAVAPVPGTETPQAPQPQASAGTRGRAARVRAQVETRHGTAGGGLAATYATGSDVEV
jgi:hypothetical protein